MSKPGPHNSLVQSVQDTLIDEGLIEYATWCVDRDTSEFKRIWPNICKVWETDPHCMYHGCGQETFANWYNANHRTGPLKGTARWPREKAKTLRRVLVYAVSLGWLEASVSGTGCTWFRPTPRACLPSWETLERKRKRLN